MPTDQESLAVEPLVSTDWLAQHLDAPDLRVVDASWYTPDEERDPLAEYSAAHIPGAVFFDIDKIAADGPLPHMLPSPEKFASRVRKLGLGDGNRIVVYDGRGCFSAPRVWWMFKVMGHDEVSVLDGGLPKWISEGRPIEDLPPAPRERHFTARQNAMLVRTLDDMRVNLDAAREQVVDARSPERFRGEETEPREGVAPGRIPGAKNVHYRRLFTAHGTMLPAEDLRSLFADEGIDFDRPVVTTCGSGVSAAVLHLALTRAGHPKVAMYDGSWAEWGASDLPKER
jgi:thiosulfate/3-mercaptopyruvate sulfurtransferase